MKPQIKINRLCQRPWGDKEVYKSALQRGFFHIHKAAPRDTKAKLWKQSPSHKPQVSQLQPLTPQQLRKEPKSDLGS